jgi:hypothetical protein
MSDDGLTAGALELAERILEEVSSIDQDWRNISAWACELAALADTAAALGSRRAPDPGES